MAEEKQNIKCNISVDNDTEGQTETPSYLGDVGNTMSEDSDDDHNNDANEQKRKKTFRCKKAKRAKTETGEKYENNDVHEIQQNEIGQDNLQIGNEMESQNFYQNQEGDPEIQNLMWQDMFGSLNK